jgi:protein phosphatase PTC7
MGVADGVYMWKEQGIDSGTMARTLMETCQHMVAAGCEDVFKGEAQQQQQQQQQRRRRREL